MKRTVVFLTVYKLQLSDMGSSAQKRKRGGGNFTALPHRVLHSDKFGNLSARATKLLVDLLSQYNGNNNGDLCAALKLLKSRGWSSNGSLTAARRELLEAGFLMETRLGGRNRPTLFALTFFAIDECIDRRTGLSKHEVKPTRMPPDNWNDNPAFDLEAARTRKRQKDVENNIAELQKHLEENPSDRYSEGYRRGIEAWESQLSN